MVGLHMLRCGMRTLESRGQMFLRRTLAALTHVTSTVSQSTTLNDLKSDGSIGLFYKTQCAALKWLNELVVSTRIIYVPLAPRKLQPWRCPNLAYLCEKVTRSLCRINGSRTGTQTACLQNSGIANCNRQASLMLERLYPPTNHLLHVTLAYTILLVSFFRLARGLDPAGRSLLLSHPPQRYSLR